MEISDQESESCYDESETDEDPTFDVVEEETRFNLSNLSIKKKSKPCSIIGKGKIEVTEQLDEQEDLKSYESILKIIQGGQVEKLKVDQCKIYLRKHGLRLGGVKLMLVQRIKEHTDIVNGGGEEKYPASSFVMNCKGDACTGDVVIFEQNVYEMFNVASRSGNGLCGTRIVAGRIVKESYGAAKQQHTFTIEVLWSKGEKPLPPLHPLLIKGRNLYRLKTMRQKWEDEGERNKILSEKHARGGVARLSREARLQQKQMWKSNKPNRTIRTENSQRQKEEEKRETLYSVPDKARGEHYSEQKTDCYRRTCGMSTANQEENTHQKPYNMINPHGTSERLHQRQPLINANCNLPRSPSANPRCTETDTNANPTRGSFPDKRDMTNCTPKSSCRGHSYGYFTNSNDMETQFQNHTLKENQRGILGRSPLRGFGYNGIPSHGLMNPTHPAHANHGWNNLTAVRNLPVLGRGYGQNQTCRYYAQGRCNYGDRCKYLHDLARHKP